MEFQNSTIRVSRKHSPQKMRRSIHDTVITKDKELWSLFKCGSCTMHSWCKLDPNRARSFFCDGRSIVTVLSWPPSRAIKAEGRTRARLLGHRIKKFTLHPGWVWTARCHNDCGCVLVVGGIPPIAGNAITQRCAEEQS
jgi:hypothetical protein